MLLKVLKILPDFCPIIIELCLIMSCDYCCLCHSRCNVPFSSVNMPLHCFFVHVTLKQPALQWFDPLKLEIL
jgi:hypothetical protein